MFLVLLSFAVDRQCVIVLGSQWGDEGKGKMVDILGKSFEICARYNGGSNAGHTIVVEGVKYALHLVPSGILYPQAQGVIGAGVVVHFPTLIEEIESLKAKGVDVLNRLIISPRAHIVLDVHQLVDGAGEKELGANKIGTTRKGIGPCYAEKKNRTGIRVGDLLHFEHIPAKVERIVRGHQARYGGFEYDTEKEIQVLKNAAQLFAGCIRDESAFLAQAKASGKKILIEGANAHLLDIDWGTYPYVTSSNPTIGGALTGLGIPLRFIDSVVGVVKAYTTRVGEGPFPTELNNAQGEHLRAVGREFGTTTGRPRRCGWLDTVLLEFSHRVNGYDCFNLTKLDVLSGMEHLKIAVRYRLNGNAIDYYPAQLEDLQRVEVEYETFPGWKEDISKCTTFEQLPVNAQQYVRRIEELLRVPIKYIGVGAGREDMITIN